MYVLEDVFWVPISNCSSKRSASGVVPGLRSEALDTSEASSSGDLEIKHRSETLPGS
jgi:hypothetical protein